MKKKEFIPWKNNSINEIPERLKNMRLPIILSYIKNSEKRKEFFIEQVGRDPEHDDLERMYCKDAGKLGHWFCGFCTDHQKPRFICGCLKKEK